MTGNGKVIGASAASVAAVAAGVFCLVSPPAATAGDGCIYDVDGLYYTAGACHSDATCEFAFGIPVVQCVNGSMTHCGCS